MAPDACAAAPRAPHIFQHGQDTCRTPPLLPDVRLHDWHSFKAPQHHTHGWPHASVACAATPRAWSIHFVLLHVRLHVLLPCTATPQASVDTQLAGQLTPRSEHSHQATLCFLVHSFDFDPSDKFLSAIHPKYVSAPVLMFLSANTSLSNISFLGAASLDVSSYDFLCSEPRAPHVFQHGQDTCRMPPLLPDFRLHDWHSCKAPHHHTHGWLHASVACAATPRAWSIHLVLLHVRLHVLLPCTATPRASVDTRLAGQLTPRSEHSHQATLDFSVHSFDFDPSDKFLSAIHPKYVSAHVLMV
ncbi:hypothetical protein F2Q70_00014685 [Brassica cretica]|uniref:Uncharacterized protein n=1 Tax=Brassica cretica TaxID=69181 RepID=A0A8S9I0P3_BRACR|nr:hypothetical protein F2Q70_00014685 [Brassica cretica]